MSIQKVNKWYIYITANWNRRVLYVGKTNNLRRRLLEHEADAQGEKKTFAGRYNCYHLLYYEKQQTAKQATAREKEIKGWSRIKKQILINGNCEGGN